MRELRTSVLCAGMQRCPRVIQVSSPSPGEGKSTVAINLAVVLAQRGRTCLVEGDLRRPMVTSAFAVNPEAGLAEIVSGRAPIEKGLLTISTMPDLTILAAGAAISNPADLLASNRMGPLVNTLRSEFDFVVIDSPPVIPFADARLLSVFADIVIVVSRYRSTTRREIARCVQLLDEVGAPVIGAVLNDMDLGSADYHYFNYGHKRTRHDEPYPVSIEFGTRPTNEPPETKARGAHA